MALSIKISSFVSGGFNGDNIHWILREDVSGAQVDTHDEPGPHGTVYNFSWSNNIRDIIYRIEMYDQPPGAGIGNLIKSHVVSVTTSTIVMDAPIEIIVGRGMPEDPAHGDAVTPNIAALIGRTYRVEQRGIGSMRQTREPEITPDTVNGNFALNNGDTFNNADTWIIFPDIMYVVNPPGTASSNGYKDVELVTADRTINSTDMGKLLIVDGTQKILTFNFPAQGTLPEKTSLFIRNLAQDAANVNLVLTSATGGQKFYFYCRSATNFIASRGAEIEVIRLGNQLFAFCEDYATKHRGEVWLVDRLGINMIPADGTEYNQADLPGLTEYCSFLPPAQVIGSFAAWNLQSTINGITEHINWGFYAIYNVAGVPKIRVPDLRNRFFRAIKNIGGADVERLTLNIPGGLQNDTVGEHAHSFRVNVWNESGGGHIASGGNFNEGNIVSDENTNTYFGSIAKETRGRNTAKIAAIII